MLSNMLQQLNYEEIGKHSERIKKNKPFVNKYNWHEKKFSLKKDDWKKIQKNNVIIALNVLYAKKEKNVTCLCFKTWLDSWKTNYSFNDSKWRRMANLSALLRKITSKQHNDFHCLNCLHSWRYL